MYLNLMLLLFEKKLALFLFGRFVAFDDRV